MKPDKNRYLDTIVAICLLGDFLAVLLAMILAHWLRFVCQAMPAEFEPLEKIPLIKYGPHIVCGAVLLLTFLSGEDAYKTNQLLRFRRSCVGITKASTFWFFGYLGLALALKIYPPISRLFMIYSYILSMILLLLWRWILREVLLRANFKHRNSRRVIFVGWNAQAGKLYQSILNDHAHLYHIVGAVPSPGGKYYVNPPAEVATLGNYGDLQDIFCRDEVEIVVLADLEAGKGEAMGLAYLCEKNHIQFNIVPHYFPMLASGLKLETISGVPILGIKDLAFESFFNRALKRMVDIAGGVFGLVLFLPVMGILALLIRWESPGPVCYLQKRMGRRGKTFKMIKLRSMRLDAEADGARWARENDPRRLKIGVFMREWNLDELPQFWNVIKGEMSLVGPRPERPELVENFEDQIPHYHARHNCKPGMTGWAQVNGLRGNTDLLERVQYDLFYLENWSVWFDFFIILQTLYKRQNAY